MRPVVLIALMIGLAGCDKAKDAPVSTSGETKPAVASAASTAPVRTAAASIDQSKPENVVNAIFEAGRKEDPAGLSSLCDESVSKDRDVKMICALTKEDKHWARFVEDNRAAKITNTKVEGDKAAVEFSFGKDNQKKETIELQKVGDKWFLAKM